MLFQFSINHTAVNAVAFTKCDKRIGLEDLYSPVSEKFLFELHAKILRGPFVLTLVRCSITS